jgi:hypothetical protein
MTPLGSEAPGSKWIGTARAISCNAFENVEVAGDANGPGEGSDVVLRR